MEQGNNETRAQQLFRLVSQVPTEPERLLRAALKERKGNLELIQCIVDAHPEVLRLGTAETALHCACRYGVSFAIVKYLCDSDPQAVSAVDFWKNLPVHRAVQADTSDTVAVVRFLVERNPSSIMDSEGMHLLHLASMWNPGTRLLKYMMKEYREVLLMRDSRGRTPLHWRAAMDVQRSIDLTPARMFGTLIEANSFALVAKDTIGQTPAQCCPGDKVKHRRFLQEREQQCRALICVMRGMLSILCELNKVPEETKACIWSFLVPDFVPWERDL
jgi:hypothetical protein